MRRRPPLPRALAGDYVPLDKSKYSRDALIYDMGDGVSEKTMTNVLAHRKAAA
jgi:hypothetical protein